MTAIKTLRRHAPHMTGLLLVIALLSGCASRAAPPIEVYAPAAASMTGAGYDALQTRPGRWRIWFTGSDRTDRALIERYALRHAAEVSLDAGAPWFRIVYNADTRHETGYRPVQPDGGLTPAYVQDAPRPGPLGMVRTWLRRDSPGGGAQVTAVLDIELGRGPRPGGAHDAAMIVGSYP